MSSLSKNREWLIKARPGVGGFDPEACFELRDCEAPALDQGQILVAPNLMSVDPTLRNALAGPDAAGRTDGSAYYT